MSGGSYDYLYEKVENMAAELKYQDNPLRKAFGRHLSKVANAMHDIEWVDSGDYGSGDEIKSIKAVISPQDEMEIIKEDLVKSISLAKEMLDNLERL